jgi:H+/Cl- antiporter ClcA
MGAVYNVPLAGALITAELLYGQLSLAVLLPALTCSVVATTVGWAYLPAHATYTGVPTFHVQPAQVGFALVAGPLIGLLAAALVRLVGWVAHHQLRDRLVLIGPLLAFGLLGLLAMPYPLLLGNGKDLTHQAFLSTGQESVGLLLALVLLKPLATVLCLGAGANGGLFTPVLATGAVLGLLLGDAWTAMWPGVPVASLAVIAAAAMTGAAMQAPLAALVLVLELTRTADALAVPLILATTLATLVVRYVDGYSIYSARLSGKQEAQNPIDALNA